MLMPFTGCGKVTNRLEYVKSAEVEKVCECPEKTEKKTFEMKHH
jgi:hypothetical protein